MAQIAFSTEFSNTSGTPLATPTGYFHTEGSRIVDDAGNPVQLVGANWFGAEGVNKIPNGLWARNYMDMMDQMVESGINTIRLPISPAVLDDAPVSQGLYEALNPTLVGKTPIEVIDAIVEYAGQVGMRIFIDMHRIDAGSGKQETGLWYSEDYSIEDLAADWQEVAGRYAGDPTVIGFDVFNEPSGRGEDRAHWGEADRPAESDWAAAAETLGNAILEVNPDALIMVQGVHIVEGDWYWVGGNLKAAGERPVELDLDNRLVYTPHDYPYSVQNVPWLEGATAEDMKELFREHWGYLAEEGIAPILVGETGGRMVDEADSLYLDTLFEYLGELGAAGGVTWWGWNPNSGDTGGLLADDWSTIHTEKLAYLDGLDAGMLPSPAHADVVAETLTVDFGTVKAHDRIFRLEIEAHDADGNVLWSGTRVAHILAGQSGDDVQTHIPAELREAATGLEIEMFYVNGARLGGFRTDLAAWTAPLPADDAAQAGPQGDDAQGADDQGADDQGEVAIHVAVPSEDGLLAGRSLFVTGAGDEDGRVSLSVEGMFEGLELGLSDAAGAEAFVAWSAGAMGAGAATVSGAAADLSAALDLTLEITGSWGEAVRGRIHLTNTSDAAIEDWALTLDGFGIDFTAIHKVKGVLAEDGTARVEAADWMGDLAAGDTLVFGFDGRIGDDAVSDALEAAVSGPIVPTAAMAPSLFWDGTASGLGWGDLALEAGARAGGLEVLTVDRWGDEFLLRLELTNEGDAAIDDWTLLLDGAGFDITRVNAVRGWSSDDAGDTALAHSAAWNGHLEVGETARLSVMGHITDDAFVF